jgi:uracil-DNA glycosylase
MGHGARLMAWSERQAAMLKEMGLRVDVRPVVMAVAEPVPPTVLTAEREVQVTRPRPVAPPPAPARLPTSTPTPSPVQIARSGHANIDAVAAMDWPDLRSAVASCSACKLCEGRTQTVFGVGHANAHWMVVGEAPGEQEDAQGEPFVGKSGQLLDNMLRALGLSRDPAGAEPSQSVYIANSVKCRPPGNRNPAADELAQCEPFLMRQVALLQPKIILAMGRFAVQSLLRSSDPIGKLRGRVHHYQGVPLVVTYHPAYLLRNLEEKARAWDDLCLAAQTYSNQGAVLKFT